MKTEVHLEYALANISLETKRSQTQYTSLTALETVTGTIYMPYVEKFSNCWVFLNYIDFHTPPPFRNLGAATADRIKLPRQTLSVFRS